MTPRELYERLREARLDAGITQDELARRLASSGDERLKSTNGTRIGEWERRTPRIPFYVVDHLAHALGVPLAYFSDFPATPRAATGAAGEPSQGLLEELEDIEQAAENLAARLRQAREREQP